MLPEEHARQRIDKQLNNAGWNIVVRDEYIPNETSAVKEALMKGNTESDYLLFVDNKAIAVLEAKHAIKRIEEFLIPVPPLKEQERIAKMIDEVQTII